MLGGRAGADLHVDEDLSSRPSAAPPRLACLPPTLGYWVALGFALLVRDARSARNASELIAFSRGPEPQGLAWHTPFRLARRGTRAPGRIPREFTSSLANSYLDHAVRLRSSAVQEQLPRHALPRGSTRLQQPAYRGLSRHSSSPLSAARRAASLFFDSNIVEHKRARHPNPRDPAAPHKVSKRACDLRRVIRPRRTIRPRTLQAPLLDSVRYRPPWAAE